MVVIAISALPGTGATTAGRLLARKLGLNFVSIGQYFKKLFGESNESCSAVKGLKSEEGKSKKLHETLDEITVSIAKQDNVVIEGKLVIHFLKQRAYKIWLQAPALIRAGRTAKRDGMSVEQARRILEEREQKERATWKKIYGLDYFRQVDEADLVIDTTELSAEEVVNQIIRMGKFEVKRP